jgi:stage V sporulation protein G
VTPMRAGKLFALASVEIDIDGIQSAIHGVRALNAVGGTRIELPQFRDHSGVLRPAIVLPEEVRGPIGDAVIDELVERGLARRRFDAFISADALACQCLSASPLEPNTPAGSPVDWVEPAHLRLERTLKASHLSQP